LSYIIDEITKNDNAVVCDIIKSVGAEYGAVGEGFGPSDPEVLCMSEYYKEKSKSRYLVARVNGNVVGGCGLAPFNGSSEICELKKLFLLPESRGLKLGQKLTVQCIEFAISQGFNACYLDTLKNMSSAISLYEKLGFKHLDRPLEGTEHNGCDVWMLKSFSG